MFRSHEYRIAATLALAFMFSGCTTEVISLDAGDIQGYRLGPDAPVEMFKGIPYAAPPVGDLRWQPPQPASPWEDIRGCFDFSPACPQPVGLQRLIIGGTTSEDCLYLNVFRPSDRTRDPLPVMVWIHGGGFQNGAASMYDGSNLAEKGVIVVTINYRLGALGFLAHPALSAEDPDLCSGNYGILDQIAALEWVQRNIAAFGGDPDNVTIFGESAGSMSVACLLASPLAAGLFHRAIMESGVPWRLDLLRDDPSDQFTAEEIGQAIAEDVFGIMGTGPDAAAALRSIDADTLGKLEFEQSPDRMLAFLPTIDGRLLPDQPLLLLRAGAFNRVPLIVGSNADEGTLFLLAAQWITEYTPEAYVRVVEEVFGDRAPDVLLHYPAIPGQIRDQLNHIISDYIMLTPSRLTARAVSQYVPDVYYYYFSKVPSNIIGDWLGAFHSAEIPYVFGSLAGRAALTGSDRRLSQALQAYWTQFAATANPNLDGYPAWPAYTEERDEYMELGVTIESGANLLLEQVDLFSGIILDWLAS